MTTNTTGTTTGLGTTGPLTPSTTDEVKERATEAVGTARQEAGAVAGTAKEQAQQVASTAKDQAGQVVTTTVEQSKHLLTEATDQLHAQAAQQTQKLGESIRQVAQQLSQMAGAGEPGSTAHTLATRAGEQLQRTASAIETKSPGDLVAELQSYARRKPGAFLAAAAVSGFALGRLASAARKASQAPEPATPTGQVTGGTLASPIDSMSTPITSSSDMVPGTPTTERYPSSGFGSAEPGGMP
jgi:hypothetical protein